MNNEQLIETFIEDVTRTSQFRSDYPYDKPSVEYGARAALEKGQKFTKAFVDELTKIKIETLEEENKQLKEALEEKSLQGLGTVAKNTELRVRIQELRDAIKPYAKAYDENDLTMDWSDCGKDLSEALKEDEKFNE